MGWVRRPGGAESDDSVSLGSDAWNPDLLLELGEALLATGNAKKAETVARRIVLLEPYSAHARVLLAYALVGQDRGSDAKLAAVEAVRLAPTESTSLEALAASCITERQPAEAE